MNRHILAVFVIALILVGILVALPKAVVKNETGANRDKVEKTESDDQHGSDTQAPKLTAEQSKKVAELKQILVQKPTDAQTLNNIAEVYAQANRFDSAAFYVEKIALNAPTENNWLRVGDAYYQAYTLALKPENIQAMAEKTQQAYKKVLETNPRQLQAKTNMAMTYVQSGSPMQAIGILREVLDEKPDYEPALMNLGVLSMQSGQFDKAVERFEVVLHHNPKNINAQLGLAYSLKELGKKAEAKQIFEKLKNQTQDKVLLDEINKALDDLK